MVEPSLQRLAIEIYLRAGRLYVPNLKNWTVDELEDMLTEYDAIVEEIKTDYMRQYEELYSEYKELDKELETTQTLVSEGIIDTSEVNSILIDIKKRRDSLEDRCTKLKRTMTNDISNELSVVMNTVLEYEIDDCITSFKLSVYEKFLFYKYCFKLGVAAKAFTKKPIWAKEYEKIGRADILSSMAEILAKHTGDVDKFLHDWGLVKSKLANKVYVNLDEVEAYFMRALKLNVPRGL